MFFNVQFLVRCLHVLCGMQNVSRHSSWTNAEYQLCFLLCCLLGREQLGYECLIPPDVSLILLVHGWTEWLQPYWYIGLSRLSGLQKPKTNSIFGITNDTGFQRCALNSGVAHIKKVAIFQFPFSSSIFNILEKNND